MASKNTENTIAGDILIINELSKHLKYSQVEKQFLIRLAKQGIVAVESLLEQSISKVGRIKRCLKDGQDFEDGSDAKKTTVGLISVDTGARGCTVGNVSSKNGILRIIAAEPMTSEIFYFKIPNHEIIGKINIKITFDKEGGVPRKILNKVLSKNFFDEVIIPKTFNERAWVMYRVENFKELCS